MKYKTKAFLCCVSILNTSKKLNTRDIKNMLFVCALYHQYRNNIFWLHNILTKHVRYFFRTRDKHTRQEIFRIYMKTKIVATNNLPCCYFVVILTHILLLDRAKVRSLDSRIHIYWNYKVCQTRRGTDANNLSALLFVISVSDWIGIPSK